MNTRSITAQLIMVWALLVVLLSAATQSFAATTLDTTFKPVLAKAGQITGVVPLANSKVLVIGNFASISGVARKNIARLNADGSVDTGFQLDSRIPADMIYAATVQADGKILIGGQITVYGETESQNYLFRLNSDGTWDTTFKAGGYIYGNPGTSYGLDGAVRAIAVDANGKILVGGDFTAPKNHIVRLNPLDGSEDATFNPGTGADGAVTHIVLQSTGHIVIGGSFGTVNGTAKAKIARLASTGALDAAFGTGLYGGSLQALAVQADDKLLLGGSFFGLDGTYDLPKLIRTSAAGVLDSTFTQLVPYIDKQGQTQYSPAASYFGAITSLAVLSDKIVVGGWNPVMYFNGSPTDHNAQFYVLQGTDGAFVGYTHFKGKPTDILALAKRSDGLAVAGGSFTQLDDGTDAYFYGLSQLDPANYYRPLASFKPVVGGQADVRSLALQSDGKLIVGGDFYLANGVAKNGVARFSSNGSLDTTLSVPATAGGVVTGVLARSDGKLVMGGSFYNIGDQTYKDIALMSSVGTLEASAYVGGVSALAWYPGDKVLAVMPHSPGIKRLNADLAADVAFDPGTGISNSQQPDFEFDRVNTVAVQPDGKILLGGSFSTFSGVSRQNVLRLNANGSIDSSFTSPTFTVFNGRSEIFSIALQADGRILLSGRFSTVNGNIRPIVVRLNSDGTVDTSFQGPFSDSGATANVVYLQADGKIVVGGNMQVVEGQNTYNSLVRLNADGSRDTDLTGSTTGIVKTVLSAPLSTTGQLLAGGTIEAVDSTALFGLARFQMPALQYLLTVNKAGSGAGTVTTNTGTLVWSGATGTGLYAGGTVTLTAVASAGSAFSGWSGEGCSGTGTCTVSMSAARYVVATFVATQSTLSVTLSGTGGGSVFSTPSGIDCPASSCSGQFTTGSDVSLTAVPNASSAFGGWGGDCSGTAGCTVVMNGAKSASAMFNAAKAQIGTTGYATLAAAYATNFGATPILLLDGNLAESLTVTKAVTLKGGYNATFTALTGLFSNLTAPLTISTGSLTASMLVIK